MLEIRPTTPASIIEGADELIYMDVVASLYGRNHLSSLIKRAAKEIFVPMTVGGGIREALMMSLMCCVVVPIKWLSIRLQ